MSFPRAYPHNAIEQIADDVFMARGSIKLNPVIRFSRNMAIVRQDGALTLVDPIRLNKAGLRQLDALGEVKHIMRLGAFHGLDDPFYMDRYKPAFWSQEGGETYVEPPIDHVLTEGGALPFSGAKLFCFGNTKAPESALVLESGKGILLTCDAIQNYRNFSNNNLLARIVMPFIGFSKTTQIGPIWLKLATPEGASLRSEFDRLLELDFDSLLGAHGTLLKTGAKKAVGKAIKKAFPG